MEELILLFEIEKKKPAYIYKYVDGLSTKVYDNEFVEFVAGAYEALSLLQGKELLCSK